MFLYGYNGLRLVVCTVPNIIEMAGPKIKGRDMILEFSTPNVKGYREMSICFIY